MMSMIKQGALGLIILVIVIGTWLGGRRRRKHQPPVVDEDDLFADLAPRQLPMTDAPQEPQHMAVAAEINEAVVAPAARWWHWPTSSPTTSRESSPAGSSPREG